MPKKPDKTLVTKSGTYKSQLKASAKYTGEGSDVDKSERKVESVRLRVPVGWGNKMKEYVATSDKYKSVNAMLCDLIKKEVGIAENPDD